MGGGVNGSTSIDSSFFSAAKTGGAVVGVWAPALHDGTYSGGLAHFSFTSPDIGAGWASSSLITNRFSCTAAGGGHSVDPWFQASHIEAQGFNITSCGNIDYATRSLSPARSATRPAPSGAAASSAPPSPWLATTRADIQPQAIRANDPRPEVGHSLRQNGPLCSSSVV
jgi:hypothetical protein